MKHPTTARSARPATAGLLRTGALGLLCLAACGTTGNRRVPSESPRAVPGVPSRPPAAPSVATRDGSGAAAATTPVATVATSTQGETSATIATVAGHEIHASDLLELWLFRESPKVRAYLEEMVLSSLVLAEAHRLEMTIDVARLERAVERSIEGLRAQIQKSAPDLEIDDFIRQRLGLDPTVYRARLRRETEIDLLAERCVRAWLVQTDRAEVRVIVVEERETADVVQQKLDAGVDFGDLAREFSVEESGKEGGRVPPIVRSDAALSRLAFTTAVGKVGGPVLEQGRYLFLHVDARQVPLAGEWSKLRDVVEESLAQRPIEDPEYWQWKMSMLERYTVDMTPFLRMVGEPTGGPGADRLPGASPGASAGTSSAAPPGNP